MRGTAPSSCLIQRGHPRGQSGCPYRCRGEKRRKRSRHMAEVTRTVHMESIVSEPAGYERPSSAGSAAARGRVVCAPPVRAMPGQRALRRVKVGRSALRFARRALPQSALGIRAVPAMPRVFRLCVQPLLRLQPVCRASRAKVCTDMQPAAAAESHPPSQP